MQIYPGYTVAKIEDELSYREIEEMSKWWKQHPPDYYNTKMLRDMFAAFVGCKIERPEDEPTIEKTVEIFRALGF